jgi:ABC-2 type transport system ATP-binding protein
MKGKGMSDIAIEVKGLSKKYATKWALNGIDLALAQGEIHAVVGANGAGKSTLMRILLGFEPATAGDSTVLGQNSQQLSAQIRGDIGYVNESHGLPLWLSVAQLVELQRSSFESFDPQVFTDTSQPFNFDPQQKVAQLSHGQRAGLNLSLVLAQSPKLLLLDEPTLGLDVVVKQAFLQVLLQRQAEQNMTVLYCSHHMDELERVADNLVLIDNGQVTFNQSPDSFTARVTRWIGQNSQLDLSQLPGLLSYNVNQEQCQIMVLDQSEQQLKQHLSELGAEPMISAPVNFTEAVAAVLSSTYNHKEKQS